MHIDIRISQLKTRLRETQEELTKLETTRTQSLELDRIPHVDAVNKLRNLYLQATRSDDARDFILEVIEDPQLVDWFGS